MRCCKLTPARCGVPGGHGRPGHDEIARFSCFSDQPITTRQFLHCRTTLQNLDPTSKLSLPLPKAQTSPLRDGATHFVLPRAAALRHTIERRAVLEHFNRCSTGERLLRESIPWGERDEHDQGPGFQPLQVQEWWGPELVVPILHGRSDGCAVRCRR
jgi:hypothetical protein